MSDDANPWDGIAYEAPPGVPTEVWKDALYALWQGYEDGADDEPEPNLEPLAGNPLANIIFDALVTHPEADVLYRAERVADAILATIDARISDAARPYPDIDGPDTPGQPTGATMTADHDDITDAHATAAFGAMSPRSFGWSDGERILNGRASLIALRDAGFGVTMPEPRYYAQRFSPESWGVIDRLNPNAAAPYFPESHPDAEAAAKAEAARLERGEYGGDA